jgi:hypothetical protein
LNFHPIINCCCNFSAHGVYTGLTLWLSNILQMLMFNSSCLCKWPQTRRGWTYLHRNGNWFPFLVSACLVTCRFNVAHQVKMLAKLRERFIDNKLQERNTIRPLVKLHLNCFLNAR